MDFRESLEFLAGLPKFAPPSAGGAKPFNLGTIRALMAGLGNPQDRLDFVHVGGTNGKGSTIAFLNSILEESGIRVGVFTSPFLQRPTEMIKLGSKEIAEEDFAGLMTELALACQNQGLFPSEFEALCALAFLYFAQEKCQVVLLEVGLGGRLDATNIIRRPLLAILGPIAYDHMEVLGHTLEEISLEKAGIIKPGSRLLTYPQVPAVMAILGQVCRQNQAGFYEADLAQVISSDLDRQVFNLATYPELGALAITMPGCYQVHNAGLAAQAALLLRRDFGQISNEAIKKGLVKAVWPGRFEVLGRRPYVVADGSHNLAGTQALSQSLRAYFPNQVISFLVGILADKEALKMLDLILPLAHKVYAVRVPTPRSLDPEVIKAYVTSRGKEAESFDRIEAALDSALSQISSDQVLCICGSLYYLDRVRQYFL